MFKMREFLTHRNGGRPFRVVIDDNAHTLRVYKDLRYDEDLKCRVFAEEPQYVLEFERVFIGNDTTAGYNVEGCAILAITHAGRRMHFIGHVVSEFTLRDEDEFVAFRVFMGGNDVPYPWVECTRNTYLMIEPVYLPNYTRGEFDGKDGSAYDPYRHYYGMHIGMCSSRFSDGANWDHIYALARINGGMGKYFGEHFPFAPEVIIPCEC